MKLSLSTWSAIVIVTLIAMLGGAVRFAIAMQELLWLDELHTSWVIQASIGEVAGRAADGNQSPLFFWLTWIPVRILGDSEFSLRFVSWLAGIGVMLSAAWLVWKWTCSTVAASVAATLIAIDMQFIFYATEARPYALLQVMSVVQVALFWSLLHPSLCKVPTDLESRPKPFAPAWGLAIISAILIYIHITSIWLFVAELIFLPMYFTVPGLFRSNVTMRQIRNLGRRLTGTAVVSALACIPIFIQVFSVFQRRGNWELVSSPANVLRDVSETFVLAIVIPLTCLAVFVVVEHLFQSRQETGDFDSTPESTTRSRLPLGFLALTFVIFWAIVPIACVVSFAVFGIAPVALSRYTLVGSAAFPIFAGLVVAIVKTTPKRLAIGMLIVGAALWQSPFVNFGLRNWELPLLRAENWKSPIDVINADQSKSGHPVFLFSNLIEDVDAIQNQESGFQRYLLFPVNGLYQVEASERELIPRPTIASNHFAEGDVATIQRHHGAWVLVRGHPELLDEIAGELGKRLTDVLGQDIEQVHSNLLETPGSPVYLFSIDW